eukprot:1118133_1
MAAAGSSEPTTEDEDLLSRLKLLITDNEENLVASDEVARCWEAIKEIVKVVKDEPIIPAAELKARAAKPSASGLGKALAGRPPTRETDATPDAISKPISLVDAVIGLFMEGIRPGDMTQDKAVALTERMNEMLKKYLGLFKLTTRDVLGNLKLNSWRDTRHRKAATGVDGWEGYVARNQQFDYQKDISQTKAFKTWNKAKDDALELLIPLITKAKKDEIENKLTWTPGAKDRINYKTCVGELMSGFHANNEYRNVMNMDGFHGVLRPKSHHPRHDHAIASVSGGYSGDYSHHYNPLISGEYNDVSDQSSLLIGGVVGASAVVIIMLIFCLGLAFGMIIYWGYSQKRALDVKRKKV